MAGNGWGDPDLGRPVPHSYRPDDVLDLVLAAVAPDDVEAVSNLAISVVRDGNAPRFGKRFHTRSNVHAVSQQIATLGNYVTDIDADAEADLLVLIYLGVALSHTALHRERGSNLGNSNNRLSPAVLAIRPPCSDNRGSMNSAR
jgi:hypothetical protein